MEQAALEAQSLLECGFQSAVDRLLGHQHGRTRVRSNLRGCRQRLVQKLVCGHDARHKARALGFRRIHHPAGQYQIHRLRPADRARQALRAAHAGNDAERDFRLAELCRLRCNDEITHHRHFAAAAKRKAADRSDDRLAGIGNVSPAAKEIALVGVDEIK